ncbi:MAG: ABC transporter ATP-binding protein [Pseudomonadota bacterium]
MIMRAVVWMLVGAAATALIAWLTRSMINTVFLDGSARALWGVSILVAGAFAMRGFAEYFQRTTLQVVSASMSAQLQMRMFRRLINTNMNTLTVESPTRVAAKITRFSGAASGLVLLIATNLVKNILTLVALGAVMVFQNPVLSAATLVVVPLAVFLLSRANKAIKKLTATEDNLAGAAVSAMSEGFAGAAVIKSFQIEEEVSNKVHDAIIKQRERAIKISRIVAASSPIMEVCGALFIVLVLVYTGLQSQAEGAEPGQFVAFIAAFFLAYAPAKSLAGFRLNLTRMIARVENMYTLLDEAIPELDPEDAALEQHAGLLRYEDVPKIEFKGVDFNYSAKIAALKEVSFVIEPGSKVAVVGRSGSGKTTIAKLLLKFIEPTNGNILIGGQDISEMSVTELRTNISYVGQEVFLFEGNIWENIALGDLNASDEEILEAARIAQVVEFAGEGQGMLNYMVKHGGINLSGGQRQRIAIARAIIKQAPILLWDEATSALDEITRSVVESAVDEGFKNKTIVTISHNKTALKNSDKVLFLEDGKIVGFDDKETLLDTSKRYQEFFS